MGDFDRRNWTDGGFKRGDFVGGEGGGEAGAGNSAGLPQAGGTCIAAQSTGVSTAKLQGVTITSATTGRGAERTGRVPESVVLGFVDCERLWDDAARNGLRRESPSEPILTVIAPDAGAAKRDKRRRTRGTESDVVESTRGWAGALTRKRRDCGRQRHVTHKAVVYGRNTCEIDRAARLWKTVRQSYR